MEVTTTHTHRKVPVAVLQTHGDLDGSNYRDLIAAAQQSFDGGARAILLDLSDTPFISSAGIVALHTIAKILAGVKPGDDESGWESFREIDRTRQTGEKAANFKLLGLQPRVLGVLETVGFSQYFDIHSDYSTALDSFQ